MTKRHAGRVALIAVVPILGAAGLLLAGWVHAPDAPPPAQASESRTLLPVAVIAAEPTAGYQVARRYTGEIRARRETALGFEVGGRVLAIHVDEGAVVEAGQALAVVDTRRPAAERDRLIAARDEAQAGLDEMNAGARVEVIAAAREVVSDLRAQVDVATRKAARRKLLLDRGRISAEEYDEFQSSVDSLEARLEAARQRLGELQNGIREETIRAQAARVKGLEAQIARVDVDLADGTLVAPFAGRVKTRHVDEGAVIAIGAPVLTLVEDGRLEAWVGVPPDIASSLAPESRVAIHVDDMHLDGTVQERLPATDRATRTQTVVIALASDAATRVVPGQVARLEIVRDVEAAGQWVPVDSLARGVRGLWAVFAAESDSDATVVVRHHVEVLHVDGERALVRGTLADGANVITGDIRRVVPGQRVEAK